MSVPPGAESGPPPLSSAPRVRGYRRCLSGTIPRSNGCGRVVCRPPLIRRVTLKKVSRTYDGLIGKLSPAAAFAWSDTSPHSSSQSGHARAGAPALHTLQQNSSQFFMMEHRNPSVGWFNVAETQQTEKQPIKTNGIEVLETREWLDSLDYVLSHGGPDRAGRLLQQLALHARREAGINLPFSATTPYQNTIPSRQQPPFPGSQEMERRIKSLVRWNAMAMVVRANKIQEGIGGHISTYASAATLYEVAFNHFLRAQTENGDRDIVYFQGHAAPGMYARAYLEGRISKEKLQNFRRELKPGGGLSSYPHPWLMPEFWEFPTVSMGLGPIQAIYHARFIKYLDNLIFVVNCNLQRLDGPVRGNGKIIQELEAIFRGAGWNVIKLIWGTDWDPIIQADRDGLLVRRMGEITDGQYQKYFVESGAYFRQNFFGTDPRLLKMVEHLSDEQLARMRLGGHDPIKVHAAYKAAVDHVGSPTIILAKTIKGYGLGEAGEGKNITHQQKKLNDDELQIFRSRFGIPIPDGELHNAPFYRPADDSAEVKYMQERRKQLGGYMPVRKVRATPLKPVSEAIFE